MEGERKGGDNGKEEERWRTIIKREREKETAELNECYFCQILVQLHISNHSSLLNNMLPSICFF